MNDGQQAQSIETQAGQARARGLACEVAVGLGDVDARRDSAGRRRVHSNRVGGLILMQVVQDRGLCALLSHRRLHASHIVHVHATVLSQLDRVLLELV